MFLMQRKIFCLLLTLCAMTFTVQAEKAEDNVGILALKALSEFGDIESTRELEKLSGERRKTPPAPALPQDKAPAAADQKKNHPPAEKSVKPRRKNSRSEIYVTRSASSANRYSPYIIVSAKGWGVDHKDALRNAFKEAIRQAVGVYVINQTRLISRSNQKDIIDNRIYLNADAVVTQYKILNRRNIHGFIELEIRAKVVKNDLLKYVKKEKYENVNDRVIANVLNKADMLADAEKSLEYLLKNYTSHTLLIRNVKLSIGGATNVPSGIINFQSEYEIAFNHAGFKKITRQLENILNKIAKNKKNGVALVRYGDNGYELDNVLQSFCKKIAQDSELVMIINHRKKDDSRDHITFTVYEVHNQVYHKITSLIGTSGILFQFILKNRPEPLVRIIEFSHPDWARIKTHAFLNSRKNQNKFTGHNPIVFHNFLEVKNGWKVRKGTSEVFKEGFFMNIEDFKNVKALNIKSIPPVNWNSIPESRALEIFGKPFNRHQCVKERVEDNISRHRFTSGSVISF